MEEEGEVGERGGLTFEAAVNGMGMRIVYEIEHATGENDERGEQDSSAQEKADERVHALIGEGEPGGLAGHSFPRSPLMIISPPRARTTRAKTARSSETRAWMSRRAPAREPASTPSMTGHASV